jgi:hypothetical protein
MVMSFTRRNCHFGRCAGPLYKMAFGSLSYRPRKEQKMKHDFGNGMVLEVGPNGFTFWDKVDGRWVIDASTIKKGEDITINKDAIITNNCGYGGGFEVAARLTIRKAKATSYNKRVTVRKASPKSRKIATS